MVEPPGPHLSGGAYEDQQRKFNAADQREWMGGTGQSSDGDGWLILALALLAFGVVAVVSGLAFLAGGVTSLANETVLAPLFPRRGDSLLRLVVSMLTVIALVCGPLVVVGRLVRGRGALAGLRYIVLPLAVVLVPVIAWVVVSTSTADVIRTAS